MNHPDPAQPDPGSTDAFDDLSNLSDEDIAVGVIDEARTRGSQTHHSIDGAREAERSSE